MFTVDITSIGRLNITMTNNTGSELWHLLLGHQNYRSLIYMALKKMVSELSKVKQGPQCEHCTMSKQSRASFPLGCHGELTHAFNWYTLTCLDTWVKTLLAITNIFSCLLMTLAGGAGVFPHQQVWSSSTISEFSCLGGKTSWEEAQGCKKWLTKGILINRFLELLWDLWDKAWVYGTIYPQQNGEVERKNWNVVEIARSLFKGGGLLSDSGEKQYPLQYT